MPCNSSYRAGFKRAAGCLCACLYFVSANYADLPAQEVDVLTQHNDNAQNRRKSSRDSFNARQCEQTRNSACCSNERWTINFTPSRWW